MTEESSVSKVIRSYGNKSTIPEIDLVKDFISQELRADPEKSKLNVSDI